MKKLLLILMCASISIASAQRKTAVKEYYKDSPLAPAGTMSGKITHGYVVDAKGEQLYDGPLSIRCAVVNQKVYVASQNVVINGTYSVATNYSKGKINGALSSIYKLNAVGGSNKGAMSATLTGTFLNGVPNGAFRVSSNTDYPASLSATYKNGRLVGPFSCSYVNSSTGRLVKNSGTLTQNSKFTGTWTFINEYEVHTSFINGVRVGYNNPTTVAMAKQYAAGAITEQKLFERGYSVITATVPLGQHAYNIIESHSFSDLERLGGYDFSKSVDNDIEYKYLQAIATLNDAGLEALTKHILDAYADRRAEGKLREFCAFHHFYNVKYMCIETDKNGHSYIYLNPHRQKQYISGSYSEGSSEELVYLSEAQVKHIDAAVTNFLENNVISVKDYIISNYSYYISLYYKDGEKEHSAVTLKNIKDEFEEELKAFNEKSKPHPTNSNWMVIYQVNSPDAPNRYVDKSSVNEVLAIIDNLQKKIDSLTEQAKAATPQM